VGFREAKREMSFPVFEVEGVMARSALKEGQKVDAGCSFKGGGNRGGLRTSEAAVMALYEDVWKMCEGFQVSDGGVRSAAC